MKLNSKTWKTLERNNLYFQFIDECRNKEYSPDTKMHIHHIIPKYVFGKNPSAEDIKYMDSLENVVVLSVDDHVKAHELLYTLYGNNQDKGAALLLNKYEAESRAIWRKLGAEATNKLMRERGQTFWNLDFQKEMAQRSMSRPDAIEIRSKGGQRGGIKTKTGVAIKKTHKYVFSYNNNPVLCIINCDLGTQVLDELNKYQQTALQRATPLLNGTKKKLHGWSCVRLNDDGSPKEQD